MLLLAAVLCLGLNSVMAQPDVSVNLRTGAVSSSASLSQLGMSWVSALSSSPSNTACDRRGVLKATFDTTSRRRLEIDLEYDVPSGWTINIGDSISNNGYGGDGSSQSNDAEVHVIDNTIFFYSRDHPSNYWPELHKTGNFVSAKSRLFINVSDGKVTASNGVQSIIVQTFRTFALAGQPDQEGPVNYDIYIGFNRVISDTSRSGTGLCGAYITWHSQP